jgi:hypothetical protein
MEPLLDRDYFLMTTNTEQQQAIWYVSGLAEVLAGPGSAEQADDAIVQFDRYAGPARPTTCTLRPTLSAMPTNGDWISGAILSSTMSKT